MKRPAWFDSPPDQWPPEARIVYGILAIGAERLLKAEAEQRAQGCTPDPVQEPLKAVVGV